MTHAEYVSAMVRKLTARGYAVKASGDFSRIWLASRGRNVGTVVFKAHNVEYAGMTPAVRRDVAIARDEVLDAA